MRAELISVGTELLLGQITDTNAAYLAQQLSELGIDNYYGSQIGDNLGRLTDLLRKAWQRSDLVVMTGGLGPTEDDLTREAIAALLGETMSVQPDLEEHLRNWFGKRGINMAERNLKQATLIPSAQALPNPVGTAPGWWVENEGRVIVAMPGVPNEMRLMWEQQATPRLRARQGAVILSRTLKILGLGESTVEEMLSEQVHSTDPTVATYAKPDGVHVRLTAKKPAEHEARASIDRMEAEVRDVLGTHIWGTDEETISDVVGHLLKGLDLTIAVGEDRAGGALALELINSSHADEVFLGSLVLPTQHARASFDGAAEAEPNGGPQTATALAQAARERLGAAVGLGVSLVLEPPIHDGGPAPGRYHLALVGAGFDATATAQRRTTYPELRRWAGFQALVFLRQTLTGNQYGMR